MTQKFIVNGVSYDSPADMPPEVRRQYERAMEIVNNAREKTDEVGTSKRTVKSSPGGVSIKVEKREVVYNVDGKIFTDPAQLPPEIRVKLDSPGSGGDGGNVMQVRVDFQRSRGMGGILLWVLLGAAVVFVLIRLL